MIGDKTAVPYLRLVRAHREVAGEGVAFLPGRMDGLTYRPYRTVGKAEGILHALQFMFWDDDNFPVIKGLTYAAIKSWQASASVVSIHGKGYAILLKGRNLQDWQLTEELSKHRILSFCAWNPALHSPPPAGKACITFIDWQEG